MDGTLRVSKETLEMIKHHEGVKQRWYLCPAKIITQGVGHVLYPEQIKLPLNRRHEIQIKPEDDRIWDMEEVEEVLRKDLRRFEAGVLRLCPVGLTQPRFDALVSFSFNVGLGNLQRSTLRMKHNREDFEGAAKEFLKWTRAGGRVLPGLVRRRKDESILYQS